MGTVPWNLGAQGGLSPDILGLRGLSPNILGFQWDHLLISWGSGALSPNILGLREDCPPVFLGWGCHPPIFWWLQEDRPPIFGAEGGPSPDIFISGCTVPQYFGTGGTVPCSTPACALGHRRGLSWHPRTGKGPVPWCPTTRRGTRAPSIRPPGHWGPLTHRPLPTAGQPCPEVHPQCPLGVR